MMKYKGYTGRIEFDDQAEIFHGEVAGLDAVITFQAKDASGLKAAFQDSIDDYLDWCTVRGKDPEKPFSGQFPVRVTPDLHRKFYLAASSAGLALNAWVTEQLSKSADAANDGTTAVK